MSLFIIGSGSRVGLGIAQKYKSEGYKVALGSRSPDAEKVKSQGFIPIKIDASNVESIEAAFATVTKEFGGSPNVVVYNVNSTAAFPDPKDAFSVSTADFIKDANVNIIGAYTAMKEATAGFKTIEGPAVPKVFISTGNILPFKPVPIGTGFVTGKAAQVHLLTIGTLSYAAQGYRYYFASQVTAGGDSVQYDELSGELHGKAYWTSHSARNKEIGKNFGPDGKNYGRIL